MTLTKRLLLGSAAAVVATTGAQAADLGLPVAPAVDYVQICSVGSFTGFLLPGSDVCFDINGFALFQADFGVANTATAHDDVDFGSEIALNLDARTMTDFGLLRGFIRLGESDSGKHYPLDVVKAFVQWGGLTAGLTDSFFDPVYTGYAMAAIGTPDGGTDDLALIGYAFNVGNGVTLMASIEDNDGNSRFQGITADTALGGALQDTDNGLAAVAAVRVSQAWGTAKLAVAGVNVDVDGDDTIDSEIGFAVQASAEFNLPVGVGSNFGIFGIYTNGALAYTGIGTTLLDGTDASYDAVVNTATNSLELTEVYALGAGFDIGINAQTDLEMDAYYVDVDHFGFAGVGDYSAFAIRGSVAYTPVSGLQFRAGVGYTAYDVDSALDADFEDSFTGRFRITRSF